MQHLMSNLVKKNSTMILKRFKLKKKRNLYLCLFACFVFYYLYKAPPLEDPHSPLFHNVIVHLDLKGAPPKLVYLQTNFLRFLTMFRVNAMLVEYEDMFPFTTKLSNVSSTHCYGKRTLKRFFDAVSLSNMDVIPLIQTFGRLEYLLKYPEFAHLRENPDSPDTICPNHPGSIKVLKNIIVQIMDFHKKLGRIHYVHIGGDEVLHINECDRCKKTNMSRLATYQNHIKTVVSIIKEHSPNTKVMMWDNVLRGADKSEIEKLPVEIVVWEGQPEVKVKASKLIQLLTHYDDYWVASSYKCADGEASLFPVMEQRFKNHYNWMKVVAPMPAADRPKGIILTGPARYRHSAPICELLPIAIPSIALNLVTVTSFDAQLNLNRTDDWKQFYFEYIHPNLNSYINIESLFSLFKRDGYCHAQYLGTEIADNLRLFYGIEDGLKNYDIKGYTGNKTELFTKMNATIERYRTRVFSDLVEVFDEGVASEYVNYFVKHLSQILKYRKIQENETLHLNNTK